MKSTFTLLTGLLLMPSTALQAVAAAVQTVDFTTLDGDVLLGYPGWFNCPGDGATNCSWASDTPSAKTLTMEYT